MGTSGRPTSFGRHGTKYLHSAGGAKLDAVQGRPVGSSGCIRLNGERLVRGQWPLVIQRASFPQSWLSIFSFPTLYQDPACVPPPRPPKDPELLQPPEPEAYCEPKPRSLVPFILFLANEMLSGDVDSPIHDSWPHRGQFRTNCITQCAPFTGSSSGAQGRGVAGGVPSCFFLRERG